MIYSSIISVLGKMSLNQNLIIQKKTDLFILLLPFTMVPQPQKRRLSLENRKTAFSTKKLGAGELLTDSSNKYSSVLDSGVPE